MSGVLFPYGSNPVVVACIPAFNEERAIGSVIVRALRFLDRVED